MTVLVGYLPTPEGEAAVSAALAEASRRDEPLVVLNSPRQGALVDPEIVIHHPATDPARHATFYRLVARNRVWLAYRRLPAPLIPIYLVTWIELSLIRIRSRANLAVWFAGLRKGLKGGHGQRRPMSWRTVLRLTRAGRPPIV
ncbi:hypothetical protein [Nonomuraea sp. PA05]|uniref:hypothetical protein n=1 Tax=Nonomuraea sp. PA05 TaxID=2604466 RepID=UPI001CA3398E|nr:hypothetical protein [Nonomuraea sp. PA05]